MTNEKQLINQQAYIFTCYCLHMMVAISISRINLCIIWRLLCERLKGQHYPLQSNKIVSQVHVVNFVFLKVVKYLCPTLLLFGQVLLLIIMINFLRAPYILKNVLQACLCLASSTCSACILVLLYLVSLQQNFPGCSFYKSPVFAVVD